jgi:hypothetical protein
MKRREDDGTAAVSQERQCVIDNFDNLSCGIRIVLKGMSNWLV